MNLLQTARTYKTYENAERALRVELERAGMTLADARYLIASTADGRFAPVLVGAQFVQFAVCGHVTVVG